MDDLELVEEVRQYYVIAVGYNVNDLATDVNRLREKDYELYGNMAVVWDVTRHRTVLYQPMILRSVALRAGSLRTYVRRNVSPQPEME